MKACFIFFYEGWIGVHPTIISLTKILDKAGYSVNIYGTENSYPKPGVLGANVQTFWFQKRFRWLEAFKKSDHPLLTKVKGLAPIASSLIFTLQCLRNACSVYGEKPERTINIGIDIYGTVSAFLISLIKRQKFLFLSLELKDQPSQYRGLAVILSKLVKAAYRWAECVIVQDEDRFETLTQQFGYRHPRVFYLPNSSLSEDGEPTQQNYFRDKFQLSQEQFPCLVLMAGMISDTCHAKTLTKLFTEVDNCALVFHERHSRNVHDPYIQDLKEINSKNLFLSLDPLPYEQVDRVYTAATIGLAFYQDMPGTGDNFSKISKASGKLNHYLKCGKPILVNNLPSLVELVEQYGCGIVVNDLTNADELRAAIAKILHNYDEYSQNARRCFDAEFNFVEKAKPILSLMAAS
jgi:glycosyltransferase involved in cell wall biosynthesis